MRCAIRLLLPLCILLLAGCAITSGRSPEQRHYVLTLPQEAAPAMTSAEVTGPRIGVGPVTLPGYLDRPQIFIRQPGAADVQLSEFDRWGERLQDGVSRLLTDSLSARLAAHGGMALPLQAGIGGDRRISVNISRFDGAPGSEVLLEAVWSLTNWNGKALREGRFVSSVKTGNGIEALVLAHGELIATLSKKLSEEILTEWQKTGRAR